MGGGGINRKMLAQQRKSDGRGESIYTMSGYEGQKLPEISEVPQRARHARDRFCRS
jgi:hypothetical protein